MSDLICIVVFVSFHLPAMFATFCRQQSLFLPLVVLHIFHQAFSLLFCIPKFFSFHCYVVFTFFYLLNVSKKTWISIQILSNFWTNFSWNVLIGTVLWQVFFFHSPCHTYVSVSLGGLLSNCLNYIVICHRLQRVPGSLLGSGYSTNEPARVLRMVEIHLSL